MIEGKSFYDHSEFIDVDWDVRIFISPLAWKINLFSTDPVIYAENQAPIFITHAHSGS